MYPGDPSDPSDHPGEPSGQVDQGMPPFGAQMLAFLSCLFKICVATIVRVLSIWYKKYEITTE